MRILKVIGMLLAFISVSNLSFSQLIVDEAMTPEEAVLDVLLGEGVQVSNITFNGQPGDQANNQIGYFDSQESNVGICKGILIASGGVSVAIGPNISGSSSVGSDSPVNNDPDLAQLDPDVVNDEAILEFDFVPSTSTINFNFVFASEEYPEFVGSFNDAFGFFLSGPGINGPFSNNSANIALIPDTDTFVSINNVNAGQDDLGCMNCEYYVINTTNADPTSNQFDGFTIPITASSNVIPGETYHIKLAVGDALDSAYDSAVFFQKESFGSGIQSSAGFEDLPGFLGDTTIVEGCNVGNVSITWTDLATTDTLFIDYGGTFSAEDLNTTLPEFLVFTVDSLTQEIDFGAIIDGLDEGTEEIMISYSYIDECSDTITVSTSLWIIENTPPEIFIDDYTLCPGEPVDINLFPEDGIGFYFFTLDGDTIEPFQSFMPDVTTVYNYSVSDPCGNSIDDSFTINVLNEPPLAQDPIIQTVVCIGDPATLTANPQGGYAPLTYTWTDFNNAFVSDETSITQTALNFSEGIFQLEIEDACGNLVVVGATIELPIYDPMIWDQSISPWCTGTTKNVEGLTGGTEQYSFYRDTINTTSIWPTTGSDPVNLTGSSSGSYEIIAVDQCGDSTSIFVDISPCDLTYTNVFSPNADGLNKYFHINGLEGFPGSKLTIFDRWGVTVFEDSSYSNDWDGKSTNGNDLPDGTYYYVFQPNADGGAQEDKSGFFTIVR